MLPDRGGVVVEGADDEEDSDNELDSPGDWLKDLKGPVVDLLCPVLLDVGEAPADNEPDVVSCVPPGVQVPCPFRPLVCFGVLSRDLDSKDSDRRA